MRCEQCETPIPVPTRQGRPRRYCSRGCQQKAYRARHMPLPEVMTSQASWVRHDADKRPLTIFGAPASVTDMRTWTTYAKARASSVGVGLGFVLGGGIGCVDLDDAISADGSVSPVAKRVIGEYPDAVLVEVSRSGRGLHVFAPMPAGRGSVRVVDGQRVETYPPESGRYIAVTGKRL